MIVNNLKISMNKKLLLVFLFTLIFPLPSNAEGIEKRLAGKILLQVEKNGEAWYVNPVDEKLYYLGRPADAFNVMRTLGLGINYNDADSFIAKGAPERLAGRILLDVYDAGKAYYVDTDSLKLRYLGRPSTAFELMRELGIGISNADFNTIDQEKLVFGDGLEDAMIEQEKYDSLVEDIQLKLNNIYYHVGGNISDGVEEYKNFMNPLFESLEEMLESLPENNSERKAKYDDFKDEFDSYVEKSEEVIKIKSETIISEQKDISIDDWKVEDVEKGFSLLIPNDWSCHDVGLTSWFMYQCTNGMEGKDSLSFQVSVVDCPNCNSNLAGPQNGEEIVSIDGNEAFELDWEWVNTEYDYLGKTLVINIFTETAKVELRAGMALETDGVSVINKVVENFEFKNFNDPESPSPLLKKND